MIADATRYLLHRLKMLEAMRRRPRLPGAPSQTPLPESGGLVDDRRYIQV